MTLQQVQGTSLADQAAAQIRDAIREGRYKPGTRLVERKLAAELGISHIPIREALARLSDEGLVERLPRRGARVAGLDVKELDELSSLRTVLEQFVVVRVQERLTPENEAELGRIVDRFVRAAERNDVDRIFELDREFHGRLWALADHSILADIVTHLRGRLDAFLRDATMRREPSEMKGHAHAHVELLEAIVSRDPERARQQMADHIRQAADRLRELYLAAGDAAE
jgi:DNA-binding GntR family transcriptional regulator